MPYPPLLSLKEAYPRGNIILDCVHELPCGWPPQTSRSVAWVCLMLTFPKRASFSYGIAAAPECSGTQFKIGLPDNCSELPTCTASEEFEKIEISYHIIL